MQITNAQRIVILEAAVEAIKAHEPSLESWCRDYLPKHIRIHIGDYIGDNDEVDLVAGFLEAIPQPVKNLRPKSTIQPSREYFELYEKCRAELDELFMAEAQEPVEFKPPPEAEPETALTPDSADTSDTTPPPRPPKRKKKRK